MSIEDLKEKWQSHDPGTRLNIDTSLLLQEVRRNHDALKTQLWWRDVNEIMAAVLISCVFSVLAVVINQWTLFLSAAGSLFVGVFLILDRVKHRRKRSLMDDSLKATIEASIEEVKHQIYLLRNVIWWYLLPLIPGVVLFLISSAWQSRAGGLGEQLVIAAVALICAIAFIQVYRANLREVTRSLEPRRIELEELRSALHA